VVSCGFDNPQAVNGYGWIMASTGFGLLVWMLSIPAGIAYAVLAIIAGFAYGRYKIE